jgi:hypothetical protein
MDFVAIGAMLYFSNLMGTYFPKEDKLEREKDQEEIIMETKYELKNILNMTLCNYLENSNSIKKKLNVKYFKNKFDRNKAQKYNEDIVEIRNNINSLQKQKLKLMNSFKNSDMLNLGSITFPKLESTIKKAIEELEDRRAIEEEDSVNNLEDIYIMYINYDFYISRRRNVDLNIKRELFYKELVPDKYENEDKNSELSDKEVYEIFKHIIIIEYIKEKANKDDNDISEIILLCSLWKFCLYFKDVINEINIDKEYKTCLHKIGESHFKDFYLQNKNPDENEQRLCDFEKLRNKLCNELLPDLVDLVENNKKLNHRLLDFFENESIDEITDDDIAFNMII